MTGRRRCIVIIGFILAITKPTGIQLQEIPICLAGSEVLHVNKGNSIVAKVLPTLLSETIKKNSHLLSAKGIAKEEGDICIKKITPKKKKLSGLQKLKTYIGAGVYMDSWGPEIVAPEANLSAIANSEMININRKTKNALRQFTHEKLQITDLYFIDIDVEKEPLDTVIRKISKKAGISILLNEPYDFEISLNQKDISLTQALDMLTEPFGLIWSYRSKYVVITSKDSNNYNSFLEQSVYTPHHATAKDIIDALPDGYKKWIHSHENTTKIIVNAPT